MIPLTQGDAAPWFTARTPLRPDFPFGMAAGRAVVLSFIGSAGGGPGKAMLESLLAGRGRFDNRAASLFIVSQDGEDETNARIAAGGGVHVFWDLEAKIAALYGLTSMDREGRPCLSLVSFVLDPLLRVVEAVPCNDPAAHAASVFAALDRLAALPPRTAPALLLPRIFEPDFCRALIGVYQRGESTDSGFMRTDPLTGKTVLRSDHRLKRRRDCIINDEVVQEQIRERLRRRLVPQVHKAFQFHASRIERYIVARYDAAEGGYFQAHRDNTTRGTAHRRFAVTINLNAEEYEGGDLVFPEFGAAPWRAPTGGAVVFSCSLLHEALPVSRGTRYCFLPFLYDEAAAKIREENSGFVDLAQDRESKG